MKPLPISQPPSPGPLLAQAEQEAARYDWTAAADLYTKALEGLDPKQHALEAARLIEREAYCRFRAAFQAEDRPHFKERMKQAESDYNAASSLYQQGKLEAYAKRASAQSLHAAVWMQDSSEERLKIILQAATKAEEAAALFADQSDTKALAETHLNLLQYYGGASSLTPRWEDLRQQFEKALGAGESAAREFESLGDDAGLVESLAVTVDAVYGSAEGALDAKRYEELSKQAGNLETKLTQAAKRLGTPRELALAAVGTSGVAAYARRDFAKALSDLKTGISPAQQTKDAYLIGNILAGGVIAAFWTAWSDEEPDRARETLEEGIKLAPQAVRYFEILNLRRGIDFVYGWWAECYGSLSYDFTNDRVKQQEYIERDVETARKGLEYADPGFGSQSTHALAKALSFLASFQPSAEKRVEMLQEAKTLREESVKVALTAFPQSWDCGVMYNYLAIVKAELSRLEENQQTKLELLKGAVEDMQQCIEKCSAWATNPAYQHSLATYGFWYGDILQQLFELTQDTKSAHRAIQTYQDAIAYLTKSGSAGQIPPIRWEIAKIRDRLGDYRAASEEFTQAASDYRRAAEKIHASASAFNELASYMEAWSLIEKARLSHNEEQYAAAAEEYEKASTILKLTRSWAHLAEHYEACSCLEQGEALSRLEKESEAVTSFNSAAGCFEAASQALEARLKQTEGDAELSNWLRLTEARRRYAQGRADLEDARLLDGRGEKTASLSKYRKSSSTFKALLPETQNEQGRKEIETLALFCDAWAKMKEAEAKASPESYTEAAELFTKAEQASARERTDLLALANASICRALAAGTRFRRAREPQLYSQIKRELETAADYYQEGGYSKAASWTRGTQRLFDALLYLSNAEVETEAKKKAELYHLAEQHLQLAAKIYGEAGFTGKRDEALRHLEHAKEEKAILLTPMEVLAENPAVSAGAAAPVSLVRDQALGAERYESANIVGILSLPQKEVNVGSELSIEVEIANVGRTPAMLMKLENIVPEGFEVQHDKTTHHVDNGFINLKGKRLEYMRTDAVKLALKATKKGAYNLRPRILFVDEKGSYRSYDFEPVPVTVSELGISGWIRGSGR